MSLRDRLLQTRGPVSPKRINEVIHATVQDAEKIVQLLPHEVVGRTTTRAGDVVHNKRSRFLKCIDGLLEKGYTLAQILQMSAECVDNQGRINEQKLKDILNGKEDY